MSEQSKDKHQQRQQKLKDQVDARIAAAQQEKGIFQVITGNGKGKSTSGFGVVARCVGHGKKAAVCQYIKGTWECGERNLLQGAGVEFVVMGTGFTWNTQDKESDTAAAQAAWQESKRLLSDASLDVVLLDELTYMVTYGYIDVDEVLEAIGNRPPMQSVIITGRAAHRKLIELADTVSEVRNVKHAFDAGVKALQGFDY
ncbi:MULTISPECIES: cob(I)yrinic acid a,c-diamide adenosyltransferase [Pseudoalteromonas]|uniref:cob(I)yrinic acid a,c-diamide adenosyltransferase n=1 Tax=Pseudoalteromonas TaxID=53246 RepID=UPI0015FE4445|nr:MULTISPECIES: cob(I)yrinic acid a,c-diamide adenosyltransferase [Pseudoalteromonas]MBB1405709.1 cob(I)yrinic acid a,c-diamide adenosyltransferase [Pseudoalteromonas sp. SG44-5]MBE0419830.1 cob(I)yrinic acid a,c-diamide adenosyltransferase [Pseudoalteromonas nigrifaciens]MBH0070558.1 cob(I)yrinic acid a,c-diamide adenosyltransferase [Pseudoalteromonas sp. NZS127]MBH0091758.1 cob(I)yrinic acid a,c-diamide adenosyltransferase [Pseudoalteromonas sp. SCQQ13]MBO7925420.1 cob(I)yrinic acid a,c-dia|tara:strand:- start:34385 stop:34984 length:600 start_codon:yes stop_codon:yes gene_type:complete